MGPERLCAIVNSALGWEWTTQDVLDTGDRIFQLKRLINLRLGITAADDRLPPRFATEPRPTGGAAGVLPDMAVMLPLYYEMRGWGPDGVPAENVWRGWGLIESTAGEASGSRLL